VSNNYKVKRGRVDEGGMSIHGNVSWTKVGTAPKQRREKEKKKTHCSQGETVEEVNWTALGGPGVGEGQLGPLPK